MADQPSNPGVRKFPRLADVFPVHKPASFEFQLPDSTPAIDITVLRRELAKARPRDRQAPSAPTQQVMGTCESCGWASGPVDSRETLEDLVEEKGGKTTPGGDRFYGTCPMCFSPLNEEKI